MPEIFGRGNGVPEFCARFFHGVPEICARKFIFGECLAQKHDLCTHAGVPDFFDVVPEFCARI